MAAPDYKAMYFHLAGRMATAVEVLETTVETLEATAGALQTNARALANLAEKLKQAQQITEELFIGGDDDLDEPS